MLFLVHWELNESMPEPQRLEAAQKLTASGLFPPAGVNVVRWDGTPENWGVLILEADNAADVFRAVGLWRVAGAGFFKSVKTAPAMPLQELIPIAGEMVQAVASA